MYQSVYRSISQSMYRSINSCLQIHKCSLKQIQNMDVMHSLFSSEEYFHAMMMMMMMMMMIMKMMMMMLIIIDVMKVGLIVLT